MYIMLNLSRIDQVRNIQVQKYVGIHPCIIMSLSLFDQVTNTQVLLVYAMISTIYNFQNTFHFAAPSQHPTTLICSMQKCYSVPRT